MWCAAIWYSGAHSFRSYGLCMRISKCWSFPLWPSRKETRTQSSKFWCYLLVNLSRVLWVSSPYKAHSLSLRLGYWCSFRESAKTCLCSTLRSYECPYFRHKHFAFLILPNQQVIALPPSLSLLSFSPGLVELWHESAMKTSWLWSKRQPSFDCHHRCISEPFPYQQSPLVRGHSQ